MHETKARRSWTQTSSRSHLSRRDEFQNSLHSLVHKFILMPQAVKKNQTPRQQWRKNGKTGENPGMTAGESQKKARKKGRKVHLATLMDLCHLKNSELETQFQQHDGRVVLRGDIVKDDSGSYEVFTEQGSSAPQMTAAKIMDIISRLPGCAGQAADAVSVYTQVKMEDVHKLFKNSHIGMSRHLDPSTTTQMAKIMVQYGRSSRSS